MLNRRGSGKLIITLVILAFLLLVVLISIYYFSNRAVIDCGTDINCFIDYAHNCEKSKVNFTTTIDLFGLLQTTTSQYEIKGKENENCIFYFQYEKVDLKFSEPFIEQMQEGGSSLSEIRQQEIESSITAKRVEGKDATCKLSSSSLVNLLTFWRDGDFSSDDFEEADCTGSYFDVLDQTNNEIRNEIQQTQEGVLQGMEEFEQRP